MNLTEKQKLHRDIFNITEEDAISDLLNLMKLNKNNIHTIKPLTSVGSKFINFFTSFERLETKGRKNLSFFELFENKKEYENKNYVKSIIAYLLKNNTEKTEPIKWWQIFRMYFGSISIFKPTQAMCLYCKYSPTSILDFTMGWGGRLIGACALNIPNYIGIDINENLKEPYEKMTRELKKYSNTEIHLLFQDALTIDYSKFKYDMVFTSPPYYNIEIYNGTHKRSKQEWNNNFYIPLITNTWKYLQKGGHFCFNVPQNIYEDICVPLLGKAHLFEPLILTKRGNGINYKEYIYIWIK